MVNGFSFKERVEFDRGICRRRIRAPCCTHVASAARKFVGAIAQYPNPLAVLVRLRLSTARAVFPVGVWASRSEPLLFCTSASAGEGPLHDPEMPWKMPFPTPPVNHAVGRDSDALAKTQGAASAIPEILTGLNLLHFHMERVAGSLTMFKLVRNHGDSGAAPGFPLSKALQLNWIWNLLRQVLRKEDGCFGFFREIRTSPHNRARRPPDPQAGTCQNASIFAPVLNLQNFCDEVLDTSRVANL